MSRSPLDPIRIEIMDPQVAEIMRHKTPEQRLALFNDLTLFARSVVEAGIRHTWPDWSDQEVQNEVSRRISGGVD